VCVLLRRADGRGLSAAAAKAALPEGFNVEDFNARQKVLLLRLLARVNLMIGVDPGMRAPLTGVVRKRRPELPCAEDGFTGCADEVEREILDPKAGLVNIQVTAGQRKCNSKQLDFRHWKARRIEQSPRYKTATADMARSGVGCVAEGETERLYGTAGLLRMLRARRCHALYLHAFYEVHPFRSWEFTRYTCGQREDARIVNQFIGVYASAKENAELQQATAAVQRVKAKIRTKAARARAHQELMAQLQELARARRAGEVPQDPPRRTQRRKRVEERVEEEPQPEQPQPDAAQQREPEQDYEAALRAVEAALTAVVQRVAVARARRHASYVRRHTWRRMSPAQRQQQQQQQQQ
jgi:hypothetical protein